MLLQAIFQDIIDLYQVEKPSVYNFSPKNIKKETKSIGWIFQYSQYMYFLADLTQHQYMSEKRDSIAPPFKQAPPFFKRPHSPFLTLRSSTSNRELMNIHRTEHV